MPTLYWAPFEKRYYAPICSSVFCAYVVFLLFTIVAPFIIVYESGNLWTKTSQYYEQPTVDFRYEVLVAALDSHGSHTFTTIRDINNQLKQTMGVPLMRVKKYDSN